MSKLSIIVPCYNVEKYVEKCLESLINQKNCDLKILVINDGSTDQTENIIFKFCKEYPDLIEYYKKENGGIADTRNYGVSLVKTEYFGFLDSDDYVETNMYAQMIDKADTDKLDMVVCDFYWHYPSQNRSDRYQTEGDYLPGKEMMTNLFATLWNKIYRTGFVKNSNISFPTGFRYEDAYFLYSIVPYVKKIGFIHQPFIYYVQREGSITHTHNEKVKDMIHVFNQLLLHYKAINMFEYYRDELEYIFIKFFLGNSFLRTIQIKDGEDRKNTLKLSWEILDNNFPNWKKNIYLSKNKTLKNLYYKFINKKNYWFFAKVFQIIKG